MPEHYDGVLRVCRSFLFLVFELQPHKYSTDKSKVAYIVEPLTGKNIACGAAVLDSSSSITDLFNNYGAEMRKVFNHPVRVRDASKHLLSLVRAPTM